MTDRASPGRGNQRLRTRKDLLTAAARMLKEGQTPDMDEVAAEALVSRATAYRYFPSIEALLVEAPLEGEAPDPARLFSGDGTSDPVERLERAESAMHEMAYRNEAQLRLMLAASLERSVRGQTERGVPVRQNRRGALIAAALAPSRARFTDEAYRTLCAALSLVFGTESMVVFRDVLGVDERTARQVKTWAVRALVEAALRDSERGGTRRQKPRR